MNLQESATDPVELPDRETLLSMSGLEFMQRVLDGRLPPAPIALVMNFWLHEVESGRVTFRGTPLAEHNNPMGGVHGGWYGAILDSAMGCAAMTVVPRGSWYTTLEYKVNITRAIPAGTTVEAVSTLSHAGRSTAVAEGTLVGLSDRKLYATGSTTCIIMQG